jgi:acetyl-CoA C-acetyltransferase
MGEPRVVGTGSTAFGARPDDTLRALFGRASADAFADAGVPRTAVDSVLVGNFCGPVADHQGHLGPLLAEAAGVDAPATRYEAACASSGVALRAGVRQIRRGDADVVLVGGCERMSHLGTPGATDALAMAADDLWEVRAGLTFPGAYALMARAYFDHYGGGREELAHIAAKNHEHAIPNEKAHYQRSVPVVDVLDAPLVSTPLGLYDSCPISDGAAAIVLTSVSAAAAHDIDAPVAITGTGQGGDRMALQDRAAIAEPPATRAAGREAYDDAGIDAATVDVAEVHDCFTIAEVLALEALGLEAVGEGITAAREGRTTASGALPVNLSGGLKAKGHPVGATGVSQVVELAGLLDGSHPNADRVPEARTGVAHNAGGTVGTAVVHVLEVVA